PRRAAGAGGGCRSRLRGREGQAPDGRRHPRAAGDRVVRVLVILDGASEPLGEEPTSLESARTPALDALARGGALSRLRTVAPGLPAGGARADAAGTSAAAERLRALAPRHRVHRLVGHRLLLVGPPPLPDVCPFGFRIGTQKGTALRAWPEGVVPPRVLDLRTVVVGARGAATGVARLM